MNTVYLSGNVGKSDVKEIAPNRFAINFTVATENSWKDKAGEWKKETEWHNVVYYTSNRNVAPLKGDKIYLDGSIHTRSYEKDGAKRYITEIKAKNLVVGKTNDAPGTFVPPPASVFDDKGAFNPDQIPF